MLLRLLPSLGSSLAHGFGTHELFNFINHQCFAFPCCTGVPSWSSLSQVQPLDNPLQCYHISWGPTAPAPEDHQQQRSRAGGNWSPLKQANKQKTHNFLPSSHQDMGDCAYSAKGAKAGKLKEVKETQERSQPSVPAPLLRGSPTRFNPH